MQITPTSLLATFYGFNTTFKDAFVGTSTYCDPFCSVRPSKGKSEFYAFLAKLPKFRKWVGERVWHNLTAYVQSVDNVDWEDGVEVDRNDIEDDQLGIYTDGIKLLAEQAKQLWDDLVVTKLQAGDSTITFDGQYFFDTDHPVNKYDPATTTQVNLYTGRALTLANYEYVRQQMMSLVGEDGHPLGIVPNLLVVPPQLEGTGKRIVQAPIVLQDGTGSAGVTNVQEGSAKLLMNPKLGNQSTVWYLMDTSKAVKPMIQQIRRAPGFVAQDQPTMDNVMNLKKFRYGSDARGEAGYGLWQLAAKGVA
jgi:phage major head subunit gpT-like protein